MIRSGVTIKDAGVLAAARAFRLRMEQAMMAATDRASREALTDIRGRLPGRIKNALGQFSDKKKGQVFRRGNLSAASGGIAIRSKSERTVGAIISMTEGADIAPKKSRWLWIATDQIQRIAGKGKGRRRVTPAVYIAMGLDQKIGPLIPIRRPGRPPILVVQSVSVQENRPRSARSLLKSGRPGRGRTEASIIAFYAIPHTRRDQLADVPAIMRAHAARVNAYTADELRKGS